MNKGNLLKYKIYYTILILGIYILGRGIPLYNVDVKAYSEVTLDAQSVMMQVISGDRYRYSLLALGISPYMISTILVQMVMFAMKGVSKKKVLPSRVNTITAFVMLVFSTAQAISRVGSMHYLPGSDPLMSKCIDVVEMVTGAAFIVWLLKRNKKYGIGGQTSIIFVNILDSIVTSITKNPVSQVLLPLAIAIPLMLIMLILENAEYRIPVQRISIHNIFSDQDYIAIKLNPIGAMPIMFAMSVFMLPQLIVSGLLLIFPGDPDLMWTLENLVLSRPLGIAVYVAILYLLTMLFSFITINPGDLTENLLKSGDSIINIRAGKHTKKYLTKRLFRISVFSATVMSVCIGFPLVLQLLGIMSSSAAIIPSTGMMLVGIWTSIYQEILAIRSFDSYEAFL